MDCLWDQLSADEKTAAAVLGYDQDGWDKKIPTNVSMTPWDELGLQCQHAVDFLGYSPELWDAEAAVAVDAEAAVAARRLIVLGCLPITGALMSIAMASMMPMDQGKQGKQDKDGKQNKSAGSIIGEVVFGIRTVRASSPDLACCL